MKKIVISSCIVMFVFLSAGASEPAKAPISLSKEGVIKPLDNYKVLNKNLACDTSVFSTNTSDELVQSIRESETECLNELFTPNDVSFAAFQPANIEFVANATSEIVQSYTISEGPNDIGNLFLFLRTGYYIQYYNESEVGEYGSSVSTAVQAALDALVNNPDFYENSDQHGRNISDAITLMDSADLHHLYVSVVKQWLDKVDESYTETWAMRAAINSIFNILYRGQWNDEFLPVINNDPTLATSLSRVVKLDWMLSHDASFIQENAARELSRLLQNKSGTLYPVVVDEVKSILALYDNDENGKALWLIVAENIDNYDDCETFGTCGFKDELEAEILSIEHQCSDSLFVRAQDMTENELAETCSLVSMQEIYFHEKLQTQNIPVSDDFNESLEMVVFDDWNNYDQYGGLFFDINTDNGGMYLEGDPSNVNNQARFIAHEADWLRPDFVVWNLTHEYVHYLDGRFNLLGDFSAARTSTHKTVWWIEGLAEYISRKNRNDEAVNLGRAQTYSLSEILSNDYNSGTDRVYKWGYLSVRFMFERHSSDVETILSYFRAGEYDAYLTYIDQTIGSNYDTEWNEWLSAVQSTDEDDSIVTPPVDEGEPEDDSSSSGGGSLGYGVLLFLVILTRKRALRITRNLL